MSVILQLAKSRAVAIELHELADLSRQLARKVERKEKPPR